MGVLSQRPREPLSNKVDYIRLLVRFVSYTFELFENIVPLQYLNALLLKNRFLAPYIPKAFGK